ncbi:MAG TPA: tetratricopeptide repeat protein [Drouetiella sp.]|jgi:tetratricopeptide (TPR) repeat protein
MNWLQRKITGMTASGQLDDAREAVRREDYAAAIDIATKAQQVFQSISDDRGVMRSLCIIAGSQLALNALDKAETDYTRAQALCESVSKQSPNSCDLESIDVAMGLGDVRRLGGKDDEAEKLYRQALTTMENVGVHDSSFPESARATNGLGTLMMQQQKNDEAEKYFERAFAAIEYPPSGDQHLYALSTLVATNYAELLRKLNKVEEAEDIENHVKDLKEANPKNQPY